MPAAPAPGITVLHCINALTDVAAFALHSTENARIHAVKLPCSGMTRDIFLLKAFEVGADAVVLFTCPEGACRHLDGNIRAWKRVERVRGILDEIGLSSRRLSAFSIAPGDQEAVSLALRKVVSELAVLGPNPAARACPEITSGLTSATTS